MKAAFLDRDGVINSDLGYVSRWEDFKFLPGSIQGMKLLQDAGYLLIVVTNQSGIARGYFSEDDYRILTATYRSYLLNCGVVITDVYHCPHHPSFPQLSQPPLCGCRKPNPGLIHQASLDHGISLSESILIGDKYSDLQAAYNAGIDRRFLLANKQANPCLLQEEFSFSICTSLHDCAMSIHLQHATSPNNPK
jgi:D-glycero-D-manno-heptose 1,7-bisphosphate phosphatase